MAHKNVLFLTLCFSTIIPTNAGPLEWFGYGLKDHCAILGDEDADSEVKQAVVTALKAMNVRNPEAVPVKKLKMEFAAPGYSNSCGIWIQHNQPDLLYTCFYEAAHVAHRHNAKRPYALIGTEVLFLGAGILGAFAFSKNTVATALASTLLFLGAWSRGGRKLLQASSNTVISRFDTCKEHHEMEADTLAVKALFSINLGDAVRKHLEIEQLKAGAQLDHYTKMWGLLKSRMGVRGNYYPAPGRIPLPRVIDTPSIPQNPSLPAYDRYHFVQRLFHFYSKLPRDISSPQE